MPQANVEPGLTPRQREVLELIGRGHTNREIGERLGISLDGAKWHVSEVLARLEVQTRDEAADYWRVQNGIRPRLIRFGRGIGAALSWKSVGLGASAVAGAIGIGLVVAIAIGGGGGESPAAGSPVEASISTPAPTPSLTPTPTPAATGAPQSATPTAAPALTGLFEEPGAVAAADREATIDPSPPPTFEWDDESAMIYDRQTGDVLNLGPGMPAQFAPSGAWAAWTSGLGPDSRAMVIDMGTREVRDLGPAAHVFVVNNEIAGLDRDYSDRAYVDVRTGLEVAVPDLEAALADGRTLPAYYLEALPFEQSEVRRGFQLLERQSGNVLFDFEASAARVIGEASRPELLVATVPSGGTTNLFVVELPAGTATFVATIPFTGNQLRGWRFTGNADVVAWTGSYCTPEGAFDETAGTWILDRSSGELTYVEPTLLLNDSLDGWLGVGFTGVERLIDPETLEYAFVSPYGWVGWSPDLRFASVGAVGGHGSLC